MKFTPCECTAPGWCERHKCHKTPVLYCLCCDSTEHFARWEAGQGMGQNLPPRPHPPPFRRQEPCRHRGREPIEYVDCDLCGMRGKQVPVYACDLFTECTERRYSTRTERGREMPACLICDDYSVEGEPATEPPLSPPPYE